MEALKASMMNAIHHLNKDEMLQAAVSLRVAARLAGEVSEIRRSVDAMQIQLPPKPEGPTARRVPSFGDVNDNGGAEPSGVRLSPGYPSKSEKPDSEGCPPCA